MQPAPSVILASRKHARLVQKVQGINPSGSWSLPYGRGKGKGKYDWNPSDNPGKGKEKGKKGKGKGKWQPWNFDGKRKRERVGEDQGQGRREEVIHPRLSLAMAERDGLVDLKGDFFSMCLGLCTTFSRTGCVMIGL